MRRRQPAGISEIHGVVRREFDGGITYYGQYKWWKSRFCHVKRDFDHGLMAYVVGCAGRLTSDILIHGNDLFTTFHGALVENYAAQQLAAMGRRLFYWKRENSTAEVDFLYEHKNSVYPLEIKAGINPRSKSLATYAGRYKPKKLLRSTLLNAKHDGEIMNVPLYALRGIEGMFDHAVT